MIGYDAERQWGHLTSGGTVANIEALWVARELKYLALALRAAMSDVGVRDLGVRLPDGSEAPLEALDLWALLNLEPLATLDALESFAARVGDPATARDAVTRHSLSGLGHQEFGARLFREFGDALPPAVVLVPSTAHYSWAKACRALGTGERQLVHVPVNARFRMDPDALADTLRGLAERRQPVVACVSVLGTTEESAVDRVDRIADARDDAARRGLACYLHVDAAWGGYAASITRDAAGKRRAFAAARADYAPMEWPDEGLYAALCALDRADSVTIDPHKLGFVPYPAGAISFRDRRVKELVAVDAPYVFHRGVTDVANIGRFILEGSKPGAAAAGVWMSHQVLPLDARGYGRLVGDSVRGALALHEALREAAWAPFALETLPRPDMNIVCFAVTHPSIDSLEAANAFVSRIYRALSIGVGERPARALDYLVTKTTLRSREYGRAAVPIVERLGFTRDDYLRAGGLDVIRCTVMNPFLGASGGKTDHVAGFVATLRETMEGEL
jgi:glutamate/tyrosine decarboxylase-like PLP-dependent enzyme